MQIEVVHVDDACIVALKPSGLLAVPGRGEAKQDCLAARLSTRWPDVRIVHRLDMATSGLMVFARGPAMERRLAAAFAERRVDKRYVAIVAGCMEEDAGEIDLPLAADWPNRPRQQVDRERGKPSLTRWRVLARDAATTRVALEPVTGRSHQLRVHMSAIGHPIVGDALYAPPAWQTPSRLLLHAASLCFAHPANGEALRFESTVPF